MSVGRPAPRCYVARHGRLTPAQKRALETLGPRYLLVPPPGTPLDPASIFGLPGPLLVEIGSGNGDFLIAQARAHPERPHLGVEVYPPGLGHSLLEIARHGLENVRLLAEDAALVVEALLPPACVERLVVLFPDPWPKKRHHKRRLFRRPGFPEALARVLVPGGRLFVLTDAADYAAEARTLLPAPVWEPTTFEEDLLADARSTPFALKAQRRGSGLTPLAFRRSEV